MAQSSRYSPRIDADLHKRLSTRHRECLRLYHQRYRLKPMARLLGISENTVGGYLTEAVHLLNAGGRIDAAEMLAQYETTTRNRGVGFRWATISPFPLQSRWCTRGSSDFSQKRPGNLGALSKQPEKSRPGLFHGGQIARLAAADDRQRVSRAAIGFVQLAGLGIAERDPVGDDVSLRQIGAGDRGPPAIGDQRAAGIWGRDDRQRADTARAKQRCAERDRQARSRQRHCGSHCHSPS